MKLVIAEKPRVAQSIATVIGAKERKDGYLQGNGYLVSWCVGHLVELAPADVYDEKYGKWHYEDLPILPEHWRYVVSSETKIQFNVLKYLMRRKDMEALICATDAGREGELIFRLVYQMCGCNKPFERLWISSMEDTAIREGFRNLKGSTEYDRLFQSALCRAKADWIVGINATRLFSVLYHQTLNVGRVMTPTLAMLVMREAAIDAFKPEPFYNVSIDLNDFAASGERLAQKDIAEQIQSECLNAVATVKKVERKDKAELPPKLYDLTTLQREANRLYGYTAQQTLDYMQSLYEKKLCTYPRTDSRYLTSDMAESLPVLVKSVTASLGFMDSTIIPVFTEQVIDTSKVSDHHAIIPTPTMPKVDLATLPAGELSVLKIIAVRLLCAVGLKHEYTETTVTLDCAGHDFTIKGKVILNDGWKTIEQNFRGTIKERPEDAKEDAPKSLPEVTEGQTYRVIAATVKEGKTTPPKHFTEDTLLAAMETAGAADMPDDAERKGLGTPATRAAILEKLVKCEYMERRKVKKTINLIPTHKAAALITVLPEQIQSPQLTAEWEQRLKLIERGDLTADDFIADISAQTADMVKTYEAIKGASVLFPSDRENIGKCPRCGDTVAEFKKGFFCQNPKCKFAIWKDNQFFFTKKKEPTKAIISALLKDGLVRVTGLYSPKTRSNYDATVVLDDTSEYVNFKLDFDNKGGKRDERQQRKEYTLYRQQL